MAMVAWNYDRKLKDASIFVVKFYRKVPSQSAPECFSIIDLSQSPTPVENPDFEEVLEPSSIAEVKASEIVLIKQKQISSESGLGLKERAKLGDTNALKQILDIGLIHKNATTIVRLYDQILKIQVQSVKEPDQQTIVLVIKRQLDLLKSPVFNRAEISGCVQIDDIIWMETVLLSSPNIKRVKSVQSSSKISDEIQSLIQKLSLQYVIAAGVVFTLAISWFLNSRTSVPNVVGEQITYAEGILKGNNLEVEIVEQVEENIEPGQIITQDPQPTNFFPKSKAVQVTVAKAPNYILKGSLTLYDSDIAGSSSDCYGTGGYDDLDSHMPVTVKDGSGAILATGNTGKGYNTDKLRRFMISCTFDFTLEVPKSDFYSIELNSGRRGQLNYSLQELQDMDWIVDLTII